MTRHAGDRAGEGTHNTGDRAAQVAVLVALNEADLLRAFALERAPRWVRGTVARPFRGRVRRLAEQLADFDAAVAAVGLPAASAAMLAHLVPRLTVRGAAPATGPILVVANHPGLFDALALFAALGRDDVAVVALDHPFLRALPALRAHVIPVPAEGPRAGVLRAMAARLGSGGAVVTFPAGAIEPDPGVRDATASLARWSGSGATVLRLAPGSRIVPAVISGVHTARALDHPLTRLRRRPADREWLAAVGQLLSARWRTRHVTVRFGAPIDDADGVPAAVGDLLAAARCAG
ncbi:1-acyl-sn-glycerol-3-phosphate acyltransferase [Propioniciclava coleopterorum]|uniref:1-acyl-sn-glycerol-3-phosphate acyltransferase n=1 Tax=Propioniciclava coleopterorum TaxID=2714937 RepID=A0A6G7Y6R6_9ACTN|nr:lysophospholipid acyltransferase family protein [Propioniciclava coleopterorum]QIK72505.1 1-acyl-sn-glycerol-3-phosphate acyltransferase [Propioniciclava coleopterorum]